MLLINQATYMDSKIMFEELLCKYLLDFYCGKTMPYRINKRDNTLTYTSRRYYWSFVVGIGLSLDSAWIWLGLIYFWPVQTRNSLMSQNSNLIGNKVKVMIPRTPRTCFFQFNPSLISSIVSKPAFITQAYH